MDGFFAVLIEQWRAQSYYELAAVILSIAYVWLAAHGSIWCWPAALISTALFAFVFWDVSLIFQILLNIYYFGMAIVGFIYWKNSSDEGFVTYRMSAQNHALYLVSGVVLVALVVYLTLMMAQQWFSYELLYLDAGIAMFSLLTTYLTVRKYLEAWIYWSIINALSIYLFWHNQLYLSALLMLIYIAIAVKGYINWKQSVAPREALLSSAKA